MRRLTISIVCLWCICGATAQMSKSFQDFRKAVHADYQNFRKSVLEDYAKFLDGAWSDYDAMRGVERDPAPKPVVPPVAPSEPEPEPDPVDIPQPDPVAVVPQPQPQPQPQHQPRPQDTPLPQAQPQPKPEPKPQPRPVITPPVKGPQVQVAYKDIKVQLPKVTPVYVNQINPQTLATAWREAINIKDLDKALAAFDSEVDRMQLPDWWTMHLAMNYGNAISPNDSNAAMLFAALVLVNRGYDIKIGQGSDGVLLMFRSDDMIYSRPYFSIDNHNYFLLGKDKAQSLRTYSAPTDKSGLRSLQLCIAQAPVLPQRLQKFTVTDGQLTITGEVDAAMAERLRDYPQMAVPMYASSVLQPQLRASIRKQLQDQTANMSQWEAANALISLVQNGFTYATDQEQFGYEKPFFMEELLYWPDCDCEDRSVFYAWIAREVMGIDAHLLHYPGHEATAIALDSDARGSSYDYEGRRYYIADPTYIGASVGMCMPQYKSTKPEIQLIK